jgi:hypothetical protein
VSVKYKMGESVMRCGLVLEPNNCVHCRHISKKEFCSERYNILACDVMYSTKYL